MKGASGNATKGPGLREADWWGCCLPPRLAPGWRWGRRRRRWEPQWSSVVCPPASQTSCSLSTSRTAEALGVGLWRVGRDSAAGASSPLRSLQVRDQRKGAAWAPLAAGPDHTLLSPADAARVLAWPEHTLQGARLSLRPAPPRASARLLLQGLPPGTTPQLLEQYVQALLCATGHPEQPCHVLASPRPDRALVQLPKPLSEAGKRRDWGGLPVRGGTLC